MSGEHSDTLETSVQPFGEISLLKTDELERNYRTCGLAKIPVGTIADLRVAVETEGGVVQYHESGKAKVTQLIEGIPIRRTSAGVDFPNHTSVEIQVASDKYVELRGLKREKLDEFDKLVDEEMKDRGLDLEDEINRDLVEDYVKRTNPSFGMEISALNKNIYSEEKKAARESLSDVRMESQLGDLEIDPENVAKVSFVVATDRLFNW